MANNTNAAFAEHGIVYMSYSACYLALFEGSVTVFNFNVNKLHKYVEN